MPCCSARARCRRMLRCSGTLLLRTYSRLLARTRLRERHFACRTARHTLAAAPVRQQRIFPRTLPRAYYACARAPLHACGLPPAPCPALPACLPHLPSTFLRSSAFVLFASTAPCLLPYRCGAARFWVLPRARMARFRCTAFRLHLRPRCWPTHAVTFVDGLPPPLFRGAHHNAACRLSPDMPVTGHSLASLVLPRCNR